MSDIERVRKCGRERFGFWFATVRRYHKYPDISEAVMRQYYDAGCSPLEAMEKDSRRRINTARGKVRELVRVAKLKE
ncbi:MAG: hypothetical protein ACM3SS_01525 [Rhodospirillaceae bacterium]